MAHRNPKHRFSDRADNYARFRPSYPTPAIEYLLERGINADSNVADIGSGTGILSALLLPHVGRVYGVEPNEAMRAYAEKNLAEHSNFTSIVGAAEKTGLPDASVDAVVVAQAFHWFDHEAAVAEFKRILKGRRMLAVIWNVRLDATPFLREYNRLLERFGTDYREVSHRRITDSQMERLFLDEFEKREFENRQTLDLEGLKGRLFSSSYTPLPGEDGYDQLAHGVEEAFTKNKKDGVVTFGYSTHVFSGVV